jgi:hypothetical protein
MMPTTQFSFNNEFTTSSHKIDLAMWNDEMTLEFGDLQILGLSEEEKTISFRTSETETLVISVVTMWKNVEKVVVKFKIRSSGVLVNQTFGFGGTAVKNFWILFEGLRVLFKQEAQTTKVWSEDVQSGRFALVKK